MPSRTVPPPRPAGADRVDAEDRKLIDRHIAEKGVTRVPRGQSAFDPAHPISMQERINAGHRAAARRRRFEKLQRAEGAARERRMPEGAGENGGSLTGPQGRHAAGQESPRVRRDGGRNRQAKHQTTEEVSRGSHQLPPATPDPAPDLAPVPEFRIAITASKYIPAWRQGCHFELVPVAALRIRRNAYQRDLGRNSARRIRRLAAGFDWARFGALTVRRAGDLYELIDGQHRAAAARLRGIRTVPAIVVPGAAAAAFLGLNRDRARLDGAQLYHAELAAGEPEARALGALLAEAGVGVPRNAAQRRLEPMQTRAVAALRQELRARGPSALAAALKLMAGAWPAAPGAINAETIRGLARVADEVAAAPDLRRPAEAELAAVAATLARLAPDELRARARAAAAEHGGAAHRHLSRLVCNAPAEAGGVEIAVGV